MPGRHRRTLSLTGIVVSAATASLVVIGAGSWLGYQRLSAGDCSGQMRLDVTAATEVAQAVQTAANAWTNGEEAAQVDGVCVKVNVTAADPATAAATIAAKHGAVLPGLSGGKGAVPDVWIPDSSTWLLRVSGEAPGFVPTDTAPIAESPVVLAMPAPVAQQLGWPAKQLKWGDLLAQLTAGKSLRPGIVEPTRDAAGLTGLLALGGAAGNDIKGATQKVRALRELAANTSSIRQDLVEKFPRTPEEVTTGLSAAPLSEEDVLAFNAEKPPIQLAALYLDPAPTALNYPFAVMPEVDPQKSKAAAGLHEALRGTTFRNALAAAGLRGPDGKAGAGFTAPTGAPAEIAPVLAAGGAAAQGAAAAVQATTAITQVLGSWAAITQPGRVLAVFDISGSMLTKVPTAGGLTRAEVTKRAAAQGLQLFDDKWAVGTWFFSTDLIGSQAWEPKVPISPLSSARTKLADALNGMKPKKTGDTGLFDTALAAYKTVKTGWQAGRVNSVILFTDGVNENDGGLTEDELVAGLKKARDPAKPVRMVIIGIGTEVDRNQLKTIADASGPSSGVFIAEDPAKINEIFLQAIATRTGA